MEVLQNWPIKEGRKEDSIFYLSTPTFVKLPLSQDEAGYGTQELSLYSLFCSELPSSVVICVILSVVCYCRNVGCASDVAQSVLNVLRSALYFGNYCSSGLVMHSFSFNRNSNSFKTVSEFSTDKTERVSLTDELMEDECLDHEE